MKHPLFVYKINIFNSRRENNKFCRNGRCRKGKVFQNIQNMRKDFIELEER